VEEPPVSRVTDGSEQRLGRGSATDPVVDRKFYSRIWRTSSEALPISP
jgi:hypothetical protein